LVDRLPGYAGKFTKGKLMAIKVFTCIIFLSLVFGSACTTANDPRNLSHDTLTIFAAASLSEAFTDLAEEFELANPGTEVAINFAGSQQLAQQISQGATADIFASADRHQMENVIMTGQVEAGTELPFIHNRLAVVLPVDNPAGILEFKDLAAPGVQLIVADAAVPVGHYSQEMLELASSQPEFGPQFKEKVLENVVSYEENVRAVLTKVILGEADAGVVYLSDFIGAQGENIEMVAVPQEINVSASYYIAPLSNGPNKDLGEEFLNLVLSPQGQEILNRYGFNY
jgi:molybdate transport system substrate-binding protein